MLPGRYTPQLQEAMTRLGGKLPFPQAIEEVWYGYGTHISEPTERRTTYRHGQAAEMLARQEVEVIEREAPASPVAPRQLSISADGAFIGLTNGEWREVKTVAVGEFEETWDQKSWETQVRTKNLTYFSRSYRARDFERYALGELHRRGLENAEKIVAINDGAEWIQSFLDYHAPQAVRIIDFAHAAGYVARAGKAIWEEESETFKQWYADSCHRLKFKPPQETIANLRLLQPKAKKNEQIAEVDSALFYLQARLNMLDYPHFRHQGYPIGSGSVESGHKLVVHSRMKGAGMRWAAHHVDPMLSLRNLVCNDRWEEGWRQIILFQQEKQIVKRLQKASLNKLPPSKPVTFSSVEVAHQPPGEISADEQRPSRPSDKHPWRRGIWPTKESWRWN